MWQNLVPEAPVRGETSRAQKAAIFCVEMVVLGDAIRREKDTVFPTL